MRSMTTSDDEVKKEKARAEWAKFEDVTQLLQFMEKFDTLYDQLKNSGSMFAMGASSTGDTLPPRHNVTMTEEIWNSLSLHDQYNLLANMSQQTEPHFDSLIRTIQEGFGVQVNKGPMTMMQGQVTERSTNDDFQNDIRRVIDLFRCGTSIVVEDLAQIRNMLDWLRHGDLAKDWQVNHVQNGFEKSEAYLTYGYRDIKVTARCLRTGYMIQIEFHLKSYHELMQDQGLKHYQFAQQYPFQPITDASQIMDMNLLPEIVDVGVEALNTTAAMDQKEKTAEILLRLGNLKLRQAQMLSDDDQSLQKAALASKAVYYFDQAIRILTQTMDGIMKDDTTFSSRVIASIYCRLLIGLSQALCSYDWSIYYAQRYHDDVEKRVELPNILFPEMNFESIHYGIQMGLAMAISQFDERHPITLYAKYVKADVMVGKEGRDYVAELVQEQQRVLGYNHPMVFETLISRFIKVKEVWATMDALNEIVPVFEVNLNRLGIHHPCVMRLLLYLCVFFQTEKNSFLIDAPGSEVKELVRVLSLDKWGGEEEVSVVSLVKYALIKTVHSPDASKLQVGARVAVWSWEYQNYWSGMITETKGDVCHVQYDLPENFEWISPLRRHTLLLSHGTHEPTSVIPQESFNSNNNNNNNNILDRGGVQVGNRLLLWYGFSDNSFYSATIDSRDKTEIEVTYDTNEHQVLALDDDLPDYLVTTRNDQGKVESVKEGDRIYVYWDVHKSYWLGKVLTVAEDDDKEDNMMELHPTKFWIQFYSGDLHACDLSKMNFYPEDHALF
ncbi:unnamed protein product [Cylindrotheca closterium]|uniref:Uncharacterized protein n=1 Tax=Cylindrotheca closterium TaxID=2856 RepID=A0AAD2GAU4_9STRA|nr:unnamed protein product [Cylindrotheca closterium]